MGYQYEGETFVTMSGASAPVGNQIAHDHLYMKWTNKKKVIPYKKHRRTFTAVEAFVIRVSLDTSVVLYYYQIFENFYRFS